MSTNATLANLDTSLSDLESCYKQIIRKGLEATTMKKL